MRGNTPKLLAPVGGTGSTLAEMIVDREVTRARKTSLTIPSAPLPEPFWGPRRTMMGLSLREAAQQAGTSKSTILRAIQSGRLSATRTDDGGYSIDPAELFRVYSPKSDAGAPGRSVDQSAGQDAPSPEAPQATDLRIRNAQLEAELGALRSLIDAEKKRADELREDRDRWHAQAERLALPAPVIPERRGWLSWGRKWA